MSYISPVDILSVKGRQRHHVDSGSPAPLPVLLPNRSPKRSPNRSPNHSPNRSPNRSPKRTPKRISKHSNPKRSPKRSPNSKRSSKRISKRVPKGELRWDKAKQFGQELQKTAMVDTDLPLNEYLRLLRGTVESFDHEPLIRMLQTIHFGHPDDMSRNFILLIRHIGPVPTDSFVVHLAQTEIVNHVEFDSDLLRSKIRTFIHENANIRNVDFTQISRLTDVRKVCKAYLTSTQCCFPLVWRILFNTPSIQTHEHVRQWASRNSHKVAFIKVVLDFLTTTITHILTVAVEMDSKNIWDSTAQLYYALFREQVLL